MGINAAPLDTVIYSDVVKPCGTVGTAAEVLVRSIPFVPGFLKPYDLITIFCQLSGQGFANPQVVKFRFGNASGVAGATTHTLSLPTAGGSRIRGRAEMMVVLAGSTLRCSPTDMTLTQGAAAAPAFDPTIVNYLNITAQSLDSLTVNLEQISIVKRSGRAP